MSVLDFLRTKKGSPQTQIGEMEKKLAELRTEIEKANAIVEQHAPKRAHMLLSDATEESIIASDKDADLARLRLERLELAEIALLEQINAARDSDQRSRKAAEYERAASAIEAKTVALDAAIAALGAAFDDLVAAIPADAGVQKDADYALKDATPEDIARAVLASGLFTAAPDVFEMAQPRHRSPRRACVERILNVVVANRDGVITRYIPGLHGEEATIPPTAAAADQIIVSRLRDRAKELRGSDDVRLAAE